MKIKNLDENDAYQSRFTGASGHHHHPLSKTTPFAEISFRVVIFAGFYPG
jgi:hypothetical protein